MPVVAGRLVCFTKKPEESFTCCKEKILPFFIVYKALRAIVGLKYG